MRVVAQYHGSRPGSCIGPWVGQVRVLNADRLVSSLQNTLLPSCVTGVVPGNPNFVSAEAARSTGTSLIPVTSHTTNSLTIGVALAHLASYVSQPQELP